MPCYDIESDGLYEPLYDANMKGDWMMDFTEAFKKIKEHEKYDKVWELIKKKNGCIGRNNIYGKVVEKL